MKRMDEYNCVKKLLNEAVDIIMHNTFNSRNIEEVIKDINAIQDKDFKFIQKMFFSSQFFGIDENVEVYRINNFRTVDLKYHKICSFILVPYAKLI